MKRTADGDVKFSFLEIAFSPILTLISYAKSKEEINTDLDLDLNSSNATEVELAKSQKEIDAKVENFGGSGKAQRQAMLNKTKVNPKDIKPIDKDKQTQELQQENIEQQKGSERGE